MDWRLLAAGQNILARVPGGSALYQLGQSMFGLLNRQSPWDKMGAVAEAIRMVPRSQLRLVSVVEIGVGPFPFGFLIPWFCGSRSTTLVDARRLLNEGRFLGGLRTVVENPERLLNTVRDLAPPSVVRHRLRDLCEALEDSPMNPMGAMDVSYLAPIDSARIGLPSASASLVYSVSVLEHVDPDSLLQLHCEIYRILEPGAYAIHVINCGDHFARIDKRITSINFLQYSDTTWSFIAGNPFSYHNRLRASEHKELTLLSQLLLMDERSTVDQVAMSSMNTLRLCDRFSGWDVSDLCTTKLVLVLQKKALDPPEVVSEGPGHWRAPHHPH